MRYFVLFSHFLRALFRSRAELALENLALRQQLAVFKNKRPRPILRRLDRVFWVFLRATWAKWLDAIIVVKPATVIAWSRAGWRLHWRVKSRRKDRGRPRIPREVRDLIRQMGSENPTWGAARVQSELEMLGFHLSLATVKRYFPRKKPTPNQLKNWLTFLRNHREVTAAMDFFTVPTITFRVLYVFFVIHHHRRTILHVNITEHPHTEWVVQQLRETFPGDQPMPKRLIFDHDRKFGPRICRVLRSFGIEPKQTSFRSPWQNPFAERWVGSVRRDCLDHIVVLNEDHLRRILKDYIAYYHDDRCHLGLEKDAPHHRATEPRPSPDAKVIATPRLGGLHHRYRWEKAA